MPQRPSTRGIDEQHDLRYFRIRYFRFIVTFWRACPFCRRVMRDRSDNLYDRVSKCRKALLYRARGGCGQPRPLVERAPHPVAVERQRRVGRLSVIDAW